MSVLIKSYDDENRLVFYKNEQSNGKIVKMYRKYTDEGVEIRHFNPEGIETIKKFDKNDNLISYRDFDGFERIFENDVRIV